MCYYNTPIMCIHENQLIHEDNAPDLFARSLGAVMLFTITATQNSQGAVIHRVGLAVRSLLLHLLAAIRKVSDKLIIIISCYLPHNNRPEEEVLKILQPFE